VNQAGLQLEQAPPIWVPFLFFLVAPAFLLIAALALAWEGSGAFESRTSSGAIGITHLYVLGFMAPVMIGSMMQMLPVLQGSPVPMPRTTAGATFVGVFYGALALPAGMFLGSQWLIQSAAVALAAGFGAFVLAILVCLARAPSQNYTVRSMWLAVVALLVTVVLGVLLGLLYGWGIELPNAAVAALHPGWSLMGWTGLLVVGVGFELVPMLQMTPLYPKPVSRLLGPAILALLIAWSILLWAGDGPWSALAQLCAAGIAAAYLAFAAVTIRLQHRRRRRLPDVTLDFWRVAMGALMLASLAWVLRILVPGAWPGSTDIVIGILAMFGFAGFVISGMLYKIMPFLAWFHLQATCPPGVLAPNMKKILPDRNQRIQFRAQVVALALLCAAALWPGPLVYAAGLALAVTALLLQWNMVLIVRAYRDSFGQMRARGPAAPRLA
jgi:hypothetical protein